MVKDVLVPDGGWIQVESSLVIPKKQGTFFGSFGKIARFFGRDEVPDVFKLLYINKRLFWPWMHFASRMMPWGKLSPRHRELVILRVGWLARCRYEWGQHIEIGLRVGLSDEDVIRVSKGSEAFLDTLDGLVIKACDEFIAHQVVQPHTMAQLREHLSEQLVIELLLLIGHYQMLAGVLNSSGLKLDESMEIAMDEFNQRIKDKIKTL